MKGFFLKTLLGISLVIASFYVHHSLISELLGAGIVLLCSTILIDGGEYLINNRKRLKLIVQTKWLALTGQYIRFSMAYQYQIKVGDEYLLVQNSNPNWSWYQHVGGKYKRLEETQHILKQMEATDDLKMKTDGLKKGDMAVFIPAKNAIKFLDWFSSGRDRETSRWREFYEELLGGSKCEEQVLSREIFPYVNYRFIDSLQTPLRKAPIDTGWGCWEILQYDILELIPTPDQEKALIELKEKGNTEYIKWASKALINRLGFDDERHETRFKIGRHAKWVINNKWSET
ncbi:hypothetical protein [Roseivirga pacifica]|uniref:SMODS-associated NUDIX domain-containing protein n=1 Tax=Roseivirga pacifica TaxID=1267423 RepID=UPI0020946A09|nr:hypothetical protein [Roseivirga pacifica]MCO6360375.1 hypothetical protein [Roseivirga pacifica]MCO6368264.1 hypothetical protein [Roseivirga pacifica]MCO6372406.1 hypothetical protein [Roseivirga pacifica]MCO6376464.1 hypothetical protein [Roseivirga pacifica]MCO6378256.1 hypothetical protein [Roseivirga pacifica]